MSITNKTTLFIKVIIFTYFTSITMIFSQDKKSDYFDIWSKEYYQYVELNNQRLKDIFIQKHLEEFIESTDVFDEDEIRENLNEVSIHAVPVMVVCFDTLDSLKITNIKIDLNRDPERCFVFFKNNLIGYFKFDDNKNRTLFMYLDTSFKYYNQYDRIIQNKRLNENGILFYLCKASYFWLYPTEKLIYPGFRFDTSKLTDGCIIVQNKKVRFVHNEEQFLLKVKKLFDYSEKKNNCKCEHVFENILDFVN